MLIIIKTRVLLHEGQSGTNLEIQIDLMLELIGGGATTLVVRLDDRSSGTDCWWWVRLSEVKRDINR